jgi:hypothetical protein
MKRVYAYLMVAGLMLSSVQLFAQKRYIDEVFSDSDIEVTADVTYATNIDFLTSTRLSSAPLPKLGAELQTLKTAVATGQPIPGTHYNPADTTTYVKVTDIKMDVYRPKASADTMKKRPVILYIHTGNFLPSPLNGTPNGTRVDSAAIVLCQGWAKRGYVAISVDYRLGWNPIATSEFERRGTLLNAVYRALQDVKQCVNGLRVDAAGANTYGIDADKIVLYGQGSGSYVVNAYTTLDKYSEIELTKFLNPLTSKSFVDTATVGRFDGSGGATALTLYNATTMSTDVSATVAAGGALADTSWLEKGDPPMIAFQCIRDPFAPFGEGTVIVTTTNENVVEVQGSNLYINKAVQLGNNDVIKDMPDDAYTKAARSRYGKTYDYIYPTQTTIDMNSGLEGLFAFDLAAGATAFENQASPWEWWDPESPLAKTVVKAPNITAHLAALNSNKDMSPTKGRTYVDTIQGYMCPRVAVILGFYTTAELSTGNFASLNAKAYPNPTSGVLYINMEDQAMIRSVRVMGVNGQEMLSMEDVDRSFTELDLTALNAGYYFVQINTDRGLATQKVVVSH